MSPLPPSGWYADPERPRTWRYWDGRQWTTHCAPMATSSSAPLRAKRPVWSPAGVLLTLGAIVGTGILGTVAVGLAAGSGAVSTNPPSTRVAAAPGPTTSVAVTPVAPPTSAAIPTPPRPTSIPVKPAPATTPKMTGAASAVLVAVAGIVDGDTIKVHLRGTTERVRVIGIDTPELGSRECYAQQAASRMQSLIQSKKVRLAADPTQDDRDRYGRLLRHVYLADGRSVAQVLIGGGFGREYTYDRAYAGRVGYLNAQSAARSARLGIWGSACVAPAAPVPVAPAPPKPPAASGACVIKGNISSEGEKIYHVPGGAFYDETQISISKGERWFCSESEALNAGWRSSKR